MSEKTRQTNGFMLAELIVAMSLFALLLAGLTVSVGGFSAFNRHQWARQQCIAAAVASTAWPPPAPRSTPTNASGSGRE